MIEMEDWLFWFFKRKDAKSFAPASPSARPRAGKERKELILGAMKKTE